MNDLREHLIAVRREYGKLTPKLLVDVARDPDHPLHQRFEWDDTTAAEKWRQSQAHELIQTLRVSYKKPDGKPTDVRAFHAMRRENEFVYEPVEEIADNEISRQILLREMERDWKTLKKRYEHVREFFALVRNDLEEAS